MILDSGMDTTTYDGTGNMQYYVDCSQGLGIYSLSVQKKGESGDIVVSVVKDGKTIDSGATSAAYRIVSLSGYC
jgi:hypothetical protein